MRTRTLITGTAAAALLGAAAYFGSTWWRYGPAPRGASPDEVLDRFMPRFDAGERHQALIAAPPAVVFQAANDLDLHRAPLIRAVFRARQLLMGGRLVESGRTGSFIDEVLALGWRVLQETPGRQLVFGAVTQPWRADVVFRGIPPEEFAAFAEPGYVKILWTIEVAPGEGDSSIFRTETRALATDAESRDRFRRYWTLVSPGILTIRREMLRQVRREAERREPRSARGGLPPSLVPR